MNICMNTCVELCKQIAIEAHANDVRYGGEPYITHPAAVAALLEAAGAHATVVGAGWLHDVIEDHPTKYSEQSLIDRGVPRLTVSFVEAVTHRCTESYPAYIRRIINSGPSARLLKKLDIEHNLSCQPTQRQLARGTMALQWLETGVVTAQERINGAAIMQDGVLYTGRRHDFIIHDIVAMTGTRPVTGDQGFVTSEGRYVGRIEAGKLAVAAGQIAKLRYGKGTELYSEDMPWERDEK